MIAKIAKDFWNVIFAFALFNLLLAVPGFAMNTGFTVDDVSDEDIAAIFERFDLKVIDEPNNVSAFTCFAVNASGDYALGYGLGTGRILVYDANGTYLYGFSFTNYGSIGLSWDGEAIILYDCRGDLAVAIDRNGNCLDMKWIQDTTQNSDYWYDEVDATQRTVNGVTYRADHCFLGSYSRLTKVAPDGESTVLFDVTADTILKTVSTAIFAGIVILFMIIIIRHNLKKNSANEES